MSDELKAAEKKVRQSNIWKTDNYYDETGRIVMAHIKVAKQEKYRVKKFVGIGKVNQQVKMPDGTLQEVQNDFRFSIDAKNLREAFEKFDAAGEAKVKEHEEEQRKAQEEADKPKILIPDRGVIQ